MSRGFMAHLHDEGVRRAAESALRARQGAALRGGGHVASRRVPMRADGVAATAEEVRRDELRREVEREAAGVEALQRGCAVAAQFEG
jgi:hypothetical protein